MSHYIVFVNSHQAGEYAIEQSRDVIDVSHGSNGIESVTGVYSLSQIQLVRSHGGVEGAVELSEENVSNVHGKAQSIAGTVLVAGAGLLWWLSKRD